MPKSTIPQLDELAQTQPGALEAALEEMVNSGFGDLESQLPSERFFVLYATPKPGVKAQSYWGWW